MAMTAVWLKIDEQRVVQALQEVRNKLGTVEGELVLDFSCARRLDPSSLRVMEELVSTAEGEGIKVVLCGVSAGVYKVLKLVKLASRFSFVG
ncbi:MAG: STAS domain-containing protein [Candidatus Acidiferrum sp.]